MEKKKLMKLQKQGWKVGSASDFLKLSQEESAYIELKVSLAQYLQKKRQAIPSYQHLYHEYLESFSIKIKMQYSQIKMYDKR